MLMSIPDNYKVLFLQGGASQQFAAIPLNLTQPGDTVDQVGLLCLPNLCVIRHVAYVASCSCRSRACKSEVQMALTSETLPCLLLLQHKYRCSRGLAWLERP